MKTIYKTINTETLAGLIQAEKLHASGWKINYQSFFLIQFYKTL